VGFRFAPRVGDARCFGLRCARASAGESLLGYWTKAKKQRIWGSRVDLTKSVVASLGMRIRGHAFCFAHRELASTGDRGGELLDESSSRGRGFLSDLCVEWEAAAKQAERLGLRVVHLRTGMVLGNARRRAGAAAQSLPAWASVADLAMAASGCRGFISKIRRA